MRMIHVSEVRDWTHKNFNPVKLACKCCGEFYDSPLAYVILQAVRDDFGYPMVINCGHRCRIHNARVGGKPVTSRHLLIAFDISTRGMDEHKQTRLVLTLREHGFTGFGFYSTFIHVDFGRKRFWFGGNKARALWSGYQKYSELLAV